ncbi:MAG: acyloxyacyl hydrolase [Bacteroidia bacterium]
MKNKKPFFSEKGFIIGYGYGLSPTDIPEGNYRPVLLMAHLGLDPFNHKDLPGIVSIFFEPQINPVLIKNAVQENWNMEFGLNVGIQHQYRLTKRISVYELISTGPHFIGAHTITQTRGFIFSDNMGAGIYFFATEKTGLNLGFRIRHISNADILMPNHGVNTYNFYLGWSRMIR